ncbi:hypothetical protein GIB67_005854 [Kingdonia uniflora]|uniref:Rhamnogalacturonan lyase domain-containing protein n=1 Tax=Kingdonia uniflora TaxID=39325 RepID=A0A7J7LU64_9MAGN|nr:hypothetical protein GIB67_005854 [Kingdonia uniflora]
MYLNIVVSNNSQIRYKYNLSVDFAYVGLAIPGGIGSWQQECKSSHPRPIRFGLKPMLRGYFTISNIRLGNYNLYAWVPGFIGNYEYDEITITTGSEINLDVLVYELPRDSPTLWEIGIEKHMVKTRIYRFRQYGLWERYAELYPDGDLIFKIGINYNHKDWFFTQMPRKKLETDGYEGTAWQIIFKLDKMNKKGTYKLQVTLASAALVELQVGFSPYYLCLA